MARSTVATLTTSAAPITIDAGDFVEIAPLETLADGSISVTGDGTAVSEADDTDTMAALTGAIMIVSRPKSGILSCIATASVKVAFRSLDR